MTVFHWVIFMLLTFISFLPITKLKIFDISKKYHYFKYLSIFIFLWSLVTWFLYVMDNQVMQYYLTLSIYPIVFILSVFLLTSILYYLEKKLPKVLKLGFAIFAIFEIILVFTNNLHFLFIKYSSQDIVNYQLMTPSDRGILFYVHTIVCYIILMTTIVILLNKLFKDLKRDQDIMPFMIMSFGIVAGITANIIHVFFYHFLIDPTYIAFVILITLLYVVFYIRDIRLIIELNRNQFILDNFREMYLMCNHRNIVVDASDEFLERFNIDLDKKYTVSELLDSISDECVFYEDPTNISKNFDARKTYLHMKRKTIDLPLFKYQGNFYLLYDETDTQRFIHDIDYVKSHDLMTNLFNRNHYEEIKNKIDEMHESYILYLFDLDGLKMYNDFLGHETGDYMLKTFSEKLTDLANRFNMIPIRMGGDEFVLIQTNLDVVEESMIIKEIKSIRTKFKHISNITFSYGYSRKINPNDKIEKILKQADDEMYKIKTNHRADKDKLKELLTKELNLRNQKG